MLTIDTAAFYSEDLLIFVKHRENEDFLRRRFPGTVVCWKSPKVGQHARRKVLLRNTAAIYVSPAGRHRFTFLYLHPLKNKPQVVINWIDRKTVSFTLRHISRP